MNPLVSVEPLSPENTLPASRVGHRLALGLECIDAQGRGLLASPFHCDLDAIGARPCPQPCEAHGDGRHALRHAGRLAKVLARAVAEGDSTAFALRCYGRRDPRLAAYRRDNDPRQYVPRRLSLTPVLVGGIPPASRANIRAAWFWPGAAYPLPANATAIRGHVRKGPDLDHAVNVPWARLAVTRPGEGVPNFDLEPKLAWGHGDDRGEFLVLLGPGAVSGGTQLPASLSLRLWVFLPPPGLVFSEADPLASLPLEDAGNAALDDTLRGTAIPAGYVKQAAIDLSLKPGTAQHIADAELLYG